MISSVLGRDCFLDMGYFEVFPNLYIVLVAGSARCRKSTAIKIGQKILKNVKPSVNMLSQKMTTEALIGALSGMSAQDETTIIDKAEGLFIVDELSTLIDKGAFKSGMISVLIQLYDDDDFSYETKSRGKEEVHNPCLSILGGSTLRGLKESIPLIAIGSGFTSRVIMVFREKRDRIIPTLTMSPENMKRAEDITHDLGEIGKLRGPFVISEPAKKLWEDAYIKWEGNYSNSLFDVPNLAGYAGRRMNTLLKVSMVMSASRADSRIIDERDFLMATKALELIEADMPKILQFVTSEVVGDIFEEIVGLIVSRKVISRPELIKHMRHKLTVSELDSVLAGVLESGFVVARVEAGKVMYVLVEK